MTLLFAISTLGGFFLAKDEKEDFGKTFLAGTGVLAILSLAVIGVVSEPIETPSSTTRWVSK